MATRAVDTASVTRCSRMPALTFRKRGSSSSRVQPSLIWSLRKLTLQESLPRSSSRRLAATGSMVEGREEPVTADEFRKRLAASGAVEFGDSKLRLPNRVQTGAFAGPIGGSVHYGIERSRLKRGGVGLSGVQEWLLILDNHLLWITGRVAVEKNEQTLTVDHQFYPL